MTRICVECPGDAILEAMDQAQKWRDQGRCIISGFHSPIEKECLQVWLRGRQRSIVCPDRSIENMRIPQVWMAAIKDAKARLFRFGNIGCKRDGKEYQRRNGKTGFIRRTGI